VLIVSASVRTVSVCQPGHAFEEHVAAGQQADHEALDHVALADDALAHFGYHLLDHRRVAGRRSGIVGPCPSRSCVSAHVFPLVNVVLYAGDCAGMTPLLSQR